MMPGRVYSPPFSAQESFSSDIAHPLVPLHISDGERSRSHPRARIL